MSVPRGHSNLYAEQAAPHPNNAKVVIVPISGGATPYSVKPLPPLAITRKEWETIGRMMRWQTEKESK